MKICKRGLEYVQTRDLKGTVRPCCWSSIKSIGNLLENSMYEIYHGEKADEFRQSLLDGSYRFCNREGCPYLSNNRIDEMLIDYEGVPEYPLDISISHDLTCNYLCTCCRKEHHILSEHEKRNLKKIEQELSVFLDSVNMISSNGAGELFASKNIIKLLSEFKPKNDNVIVSLETNGSLFDEINWERIKNLGKYNLHVHVTVLSFDDITYRYLSGVNYDTNKIVKNLHFIKNLRQQGIINFLELATVVQERNFRTLPEFTRRCLEEFEADLVRIRSFFPYGKDLPEIEWFYDVRNEYHPYHEEYKEIMEDPIFQHPKVYKWSGDKPSRLGKYPGGGASQNYRILRDLFVHEDAARRLEKYLLDNGIGEVVLYGIGGVGKALITVLDEVKFPIRYILDKCCEEDSYRNHSIVKLEQMDIAENIYIIVTVSSKFLEISDELCVRGIERHRILNIASIVCEI